MFYLLLPIHCMDGYALDPWPYKYLSDALEDTIGEDWWELAYETPDGSLEGFMSSDEDGLLAGPIAP